jgi:hypothetical protein
MREPNRRDVSPSNEEKCFVEEIHTDMHGENIMVKKSKPSVKAYIPQVGIQK